MRSGSGVECKDSGIIFGRCPMHWRIASLSPLLVVLAAQTIAANAPVVHHYRDLFVEQLGKSPADVQAKIASGFEQLFHGDGQEQRVYFETGANANGTLAYITDWANNDARTEGMSYGMMIAVELVQDLHANHRSEEPVSGLLRLVDEYRWHAAFNRRGARWRGILCDGAVF